MSLASLLYEKLHSLKKPLFTNVEAMQDLYTSISLTSLSIEKLNLLIKSLFIIVGESCF